MAENEVILRPSADIQLQHTVFPSEFTAGYLAIKDTVPDGLGTYLSSNDIEKKSIFAFSADNPISIKNITNGIVNLEFDENDTMSNELGGRVYVEFYIDGILFSEYNIIDVYHSPVSIEMFKEDIQRVNEYILSNKKLPNIWFSVRFKIETKSNDSSKGGNVKAVLTQMFAKFYYEQNNHLFRKINNSYKTAAASYKKANGTWSAISEDEAKAIISSNTIRRE